ncbi:MAG TPA: tetratricopeptide repeat protein [Thermoanaerobaculia bacterium]|nr:tetratricopeptide repeat protein [Thermoanaerobaculia bacterium]HQR67395.1 tetratricopeptide repeat protein [Thermoanaerobaculia bacterium]
MTRLQAGERALQAKKWVDAIDQLRIACFGLLDQPAYLSEGLAALALAQEGAGKTAAVDATLARWVEVEQRFGVWAKVPLPREVRAEFEALLARRVRPEVILGVPTLSGMVETEEQRLAKLPPKERQKALEAKAAAEPRNPVWPLQLARAAAERGDAKATIRWADKVLEIDERQSEALTLRTRARMARGDYLGALADLKAIPSERVAAESALTADLFVCLVETGDLDAARVVLANVPMDQRSRKDVAAASRRVPTEKEAPRQVEPPAPPVVVPPPPQATATPAPTRTSTPQPTATQAPTHTPAPPPPPTATPTPTPVPTRSIEKELTEARELLKGGRYAEARALLAPLAKSDPKNREANKLLLEAALLTRDWKLCAAEAAALEPFLDGEEPSMFYAAVGLYETGNVEGARTLLERARPRIESAPFVDYYTKKILGK